MNDEQTEAAQKLLSTIEVINETVGDAISDMFLVEVILQSNGWDVKEWFNTYSDLPNLQKKICVADRNVITTTDAERKVVTPEGLQAGIDEIVAKYPRGRSFVRPSGTEDIVRVYAEAASKEVRSPSCTLECFSYFEFAHKIIACFHLFSLFSLHRMLIIWLPKCHNWCINLLVASVMNRNQ